MKKLSLNALKQSAETVLSKNELKSISGGYEYCTGSWGVGYKVACYQDSTFLGYACTGGTCAGEQGSYCSALYYQTNRAFCV